MLGAWFHDDTGAVISSPLWRRLGADPKMIGKPLVLNGRSYTISGVMPRWFRLPVAGPDAEEVPSDVWIWLDPCGRGQNPREGWYLCYARRRPGVSLAAAIADVKRAAAEIAAQDPGSHPSYTARVEDLRETVVKGIRSTLFLLFGAAGLLLAVSVR